MNENDINNFDVRSIMKSKLTIIIFSIIFAVINPGFARAQGVLQEIQKTGVLKVGIRKDATPFGYIYGGKWKGICPELMNGYQPTYTLRYKKWGFVTRFNSGSM